MLPFYLLAIGCFLIFCEFYLAGLVLATLGGFLVITSMVLFAMQYSALATGAFFIGVVIAVIAVCKFAIWKIKSTKSKGSLYSDNNQEGYIASTYDQSAIGKKGMVTADLKPGGYISIEGKKHAAISISGYISQGEMVLVVGGEGESLTVKRETI
jgi:membrane-bound ClpP family serine protease